MCDLWDSDKNGGHCMLVKCERYTSEWHRNDQVSDSEEKDDKKARKQT